MLVHPPNVDASINEDDNEVDDEHAMSGVEAAAYEGDEDRKEARNDDVCGAPSITDVVVGAPETVMLGGLNRASSSSSKSILNSAKKVEDRTN